MKRGIPPAKVILAVAFAVVVAGGLVLTGMGLSDVTENGRAILMRAQALRGSGSIVFVLSAVFIVASGLLPASLAGMAAGAVYGVAYGFGLAATSTMAGAFLTLAISRSLARGTIERFMRRRPRLQHLDRMLGRDGARLVCLLRLSPVMPFAATSYALGLTSVSVRDYLLGTLASLPALLGYVFLGKIAATGLMATYVGPFHWAILVIGGLATVLLTLKLGQLALRAGLLPESMAGAVTLALRQPSDADGDAMPGSDKPGTMPHP